MQLASSAYYVLSGPEGVLVSTRVFAYGSNMCCARLRDYQVIPAGPGEAASLPEHRLVFNKLSKDGSAKANVEPDPHATVWGVLYSIPDEQVDLLTKGEGGYEPRSMCVHPLSGGRVDALVYVARRPAPESEGRPYSWYKQF